MVNLCKGRSYPVFFIINHLWTKILPSVFKWITYETSKTLDIFEPFKVTEGLSICYISRYPPKMNLLQQKIPNKNIQISLLTSRLHWYGHPRSNKRIYTQPLSKYICHIAWLFNNIQSITVDPRHIELWNSILYKTGYGGVKRPGFWNRCIYRWPPPWWKGLAYHRVHGFAMYVVSRSPCDTHPSLVYRNGKGPDFIWFQASWPYCM